METIDVTDLPPDRVAYLKRLVEAWKREAQNGDTPSDQTSEKALGTSPEDQALIESIWKLRDRIGPVDTRVVDAIRELREES